MQADAEGQEGQEGQQGRRLPPHVPHVPLEEASCEELALALAVRAAQDQNLREEQLANVREAEHRLQERKQRLEEVERRIFAIADSLDDIVELNIGGKPMSTTRAVLCSAEGSLLAGMFSGNFESGHKRDKEGRIFLDFDPDLFSKVLSHLRLRRIAGPDCPAPLPHIPEELQPEYEMLVKYLGLENFMYGNTGNGVNVFQRIAELSDACQTKLQSNKLVQILLSTTGGVAAGSHEEVLGTSGFHERSLENSYGAHPNTITIKFLKHRVRVEAMELRAKVADLAAHMANTWSFRHGGDSINMGFNFSKTEPSTGRLETVGLIQGFVEEIMWTFPRDFCLEHIVLYGRVLTK